MTDQEKPVNFGDWLMKDKKDKTKETPAVTTVVLNTSSDSDVEKRAEQWTKDGDRQKRPPLG